MAGEFFLKSVTIILFYVSCMGQGSKLTWTMEPSHPVDLLTPLEITCHFETPPTEEVNVTLDVDSVYYPYNISIIKGNTSVFAILSLDNPPEVLQDQSRLKVEGRLFSKKPGKPYLKLIWKRSRRDLAGKYTCLAHAQDDDNRDTVLKSEHEVVVAKPSFDETLSYLKKIANARDEIQYKIEMYQKSQKGVIASLTEDWSDVQESYMYTANEIEDFNDVVTTDVETGEVTCGEDHGDFPKFQDPDLRGTVIPVSFKTRFRTTPLFTYTIRTADVQSDPKVAYDVDFSNVTRDGFVFRCSTWDNTTIYSINVLWLAFRRL